MAINLDAESKKTLFLLFLILIIEALLRFYGLTHKSLWLDEANGIRIAEKSFSEIITELKNDVSPPLHYFLLHLWMKEFGKGELSVRIFVAIFGFLLIPAIYYVASSLFNRKTGLISAFIASIGEFHVRYSQEVRMYSMLALLGLLSVYFLYRALITNKNSSWALYTITTMLTIYTHNYGLFIATAGVIFSVIYYFTQKNKYQKFLISLGIIIITYMPWLPIFITKQYNSSAIVGWIPYMRPYHVFETFITYCGLVFSVFSSQINNLILLFGIIIFMFSFLLGIFSINRYKKIPIPYIKTDMNFSLILIYLFVTLAIPMLISIKKPIFLSSRYSISAWPAFALVLGLGLSKIKNRYFLSILLILIMFVSSVSLYWYHFIWIKSYDREIARFIDSKAETNDVVVFAPSWSDIPINYYLKTSIKQVGYPGRSLKEIIIEAEPSDRKPEDMITIVRSRLGDNYGKVFLVYQKDAEWIPNIHIVKKLFDYRFKKIEDVDYGNINISIYLMMMHS
ncbi:MAG: glycosyltransferase family 39 protein [bacterium]